MKYIVIENRFTYSEIYQHTLISAHRIIHHEKIQRNQTVLPDPHCVGDRCEAHTVLDVLLFFYLAAAKTYTTTEERDETTAG